MSYIISALQKAERQRRGDPGETPAQDLSHWRAPDVAQRASFPVPGWLLVVALLLVLTVVAVFWWRAVGVPLTASGDNDPMVAQPLELATRHNSRGNTEEDAEPAAADPTPEISAAPANPGARAADEPPALSITGYIYFPDDPDASKLFVDGIVYRLGSSVKPGVTLREFRPHSVVLSQSGIRHEIAAP